MPMNRSDKINIIFPNGEIIKCHDLIALTRNYKFEEEFEHFVIGDWSLEEIIDNKLFLTQILNNQIKDRLSNEDEILFKNILDKQEKVKEKVKAELSDEERELYDELFPENKLILSSQDPEKFSEDDLIDFFEDVLYNLDSEEYNNDLDITDANIEKESEQSNVISLDKYRNKTCLD